MTIDRIVIGICTFRRSWIAKTLTSLARIELPGQPVSVIVADNDDQPTAAAMVAHAAEGHPLPIRCIHAPSRNISIARNAILDAARAEGARYLVYVDDDQTVTAGWLTSLLARTSETGADAVIGPILAAYGPDAPRWMRDGAVHNMWPQLDRNGAVREAFSGNTLLDLASPALRGLRFDLTRGTTGGEDTAFFRAVKRQGGWIAFAPDAVADEVVPPERARLRWLLRRRYRMGQTHASLMDTRDGPLARTAGIALAGAKVVACLGLVGFWAFRPLRRNLALMRGALHVGVVADLIGLDRIEIYGGGLSPQGRREPQEAAK